MKLELKHLAPYLHMRINPLQLVYKDAIYTLDGLSGAWNVDIRQAMLVTENVYVERVKPLLYPLSELSNSKHQSALKKRIDKVFHDDNDICFVLSNIGKPTFGIYWSLFGNRDIEKHVPYSVYEYLFANLFDVFGLIEAGLAFNKNDYIKL